MSVSFSLSVSSCPGLGYRELLAATWSRVGSALPRARILVFPLVKKGEIKLMSQVPTVC